MTTFAVITCYSSHMNKKTTYTDPRLAFATEEKETPDDFRQQFDPSSTALQVLHGRDLSDKVAIVTGANDGIGYETTRALAYHGAHVILACRDMEKAKSAMEKITSERVCNFADTSLTCLVLLTYQLAVSREIDSTSL